MHGGKATGPPRGNTNALKHGRYTAEALEEGVRMREALAIFRELLQQV